MNHTVKLTGGPMNEVSVKRFGVDALVLSFPREMEKNTYVFKNLS